MVKLVVPRGGDVIYTGRTAESKVASYAHGLAVCPFHVAQAIHTLDYLFRAYFPERPYAQLKFFNGGLFTIAHPKQKEPRCVSARLEHAMDAACRIVKGKTSKEDWRLRL